MSHSKQTISVMCFQNTKTKDTQPDYVVRAKIGDDFHEVGAGWKKTSSKGTMFLSLSLDTDALKKVYNAKYDKLTSDGTPIPFDDESEKVFNEINGEQNWK